MTGPTTTTDLRNLIAVRKRLESLDRQAIATRHRRAAILSSLREAGMSVAEIAAHVGVSRQTVHQWMREQ